MKLKSRLFFVAMLSYCFVSTALATCNSDFECGIGNHCVKPPLQSTGTCMKTVSEYGVQEYNLPRTESVLPNMNLNGQCSFDTDCPINFRCDSQYKACVKR